ncbi:phosphoenolpyruvate carboxykinase (ATP) [bacterium]|nr:phosphoenolpyruvate carboxykinase (ATP) [bacterium]
MIFTGNEGKNQELGKIGIKNVKKAYWNLTPAELVERAILTNEGQLADNGSLAADTGKFTGRSPKDRFIVEDDLTRDSVWWGDINIKFDADKFDALYNKVVAHLADQEVYVRDSYACAMDEYRLKLRVITESAYQNIFANNLFLRPTAEEKASWDPEWHIVAAPSFMANPEVDGTRQANFAILNFTKKVILIGGTGYTGEIKKGIFSVLNFILPHQKQVLSMHCSANLGKDGDTAIFFGLSGTGKTTLSADPNRNLIGDDEHGWIGNTVFNFEGGCYAKVIDLTEKKEPEIFRAIKFGALVENVRFVDGTRTVDYTDCSVTENTRAAYPINHIENAVEPSIGHNPKNIFMLTADAFGTLPPISKLTKGQAMFHFISGYTAKVAGTEEGVTEPQPAFSACFGAPFLPLHPTKYADMLGQKMDETNVNVWLINTGWTGGPYGVGKRMDLPYTRAMINAALSGDLDNVDYETDPIFGLQMPKECPNVPSNLLNPRNTWSDKEAYDRKASDLAAKFNKNFAKYAEAASDEIKAAAPKVVVEG